jgi:hypothetical protein
LNAANSTIGPAVLGGNHGFIKMPASANPARFMNPNTLADQAKPIFGSTPLTIAGYTKPPAEFPVVMMPTAMALFLSK